MACAVFAPSFSRFSFHFIFPSNFNFQMFQILPVVSPSLGPFFPFSLSEGDWGWGGGGRGKKRKRGEKNTRQLFFLTPLSMPISPPPALLSPPRPLHLSAYFFFFRNGISPPFFFSFPINSPPDPTTGKAHRLLAAEENSGREEGKKTRERERA